MAYNNRYIKQREQWAPLTWIGCWWTAVPVQFVVSGADLRNWSCYRSPRTIHRAFYIFPPIRPPTHSSTFGIVLTCLSAFIEGIRCGDYSTEDNKRFRLRDPPFAHYKTHRVDNEEHFEYDNSSDQLTNATRHFKSKVDVRVTVWPTVVYAAGDRTVRLILRCNGNCNYIEKNYVSRPCDLDLSIFDLDSVSYTGLRIYSAIHNHSLRNLNWTLLWQSGVNRKYVTTVPLCQPVPVLCFISPEKLPKIVAILGYILL